MPKQTSDYRDTLYTVNKRGERLWVYAHFLPGRLFPFRALVAYTLMLFYLLMPWISIGGKQGILLDITRRRFIFFGVEFWATDTIFVFLILASLGIALFFFTAFLGRVWCGWACPETVFLEFLFRPIERLIEGTESQRRKLDAAAWSVKKVLKKITKHGLCAVFAWIIASTFLAYFVGREPLLKMMQHAPWENAWYFGLTCVLMLLMAFQFGWFREQFCTLLCPYARFQSVLMDSNSIVVGYDPVRGEPRGKLHTNSELKHGDCIDCGLCKRVCPTGIDIRNGLQLECVACSACIDACDTVMDQVGRKRGLIRYDTENHLLGKDSQIFRPRILIYATLLVFLLSTFVYLLSTRQLSDIELLRASKIAPFSVDNSGKVTNQFVLRIANKSKNSVSYKLIAKNMADLELVIPVSEVILVASATREIPIFARSDLSNFKHGRINSMIKIESSDGAKMDLPMLILGPESNE